MKDPVVASKKGLTIQTHKTQNRVRKSGSQNSKHEHKIQRDSKYSIACVPEYSRNFLSPQFYLQSKDHV